MHEGAINRRLLRSGRAIFPKIRGFQDALWLRRVGFPGGEIDFLLLSKSGQRIAVVEATSALKDDLAQLRKYMSWLNGASATQLADSIMASCFGALKRGVKTRPAANANAPIKPWIASIGRPALIRIIEKAKRDQHGVLLVYLPESARAGTPKSILAEVPWKLAGRKRDRVTARIVLVQVV